MSKIYSYLFAAALAVSGLSVSAANYNSLCISLTDGTDVSIVLSDEFKATFSETDLHLVSTDETVDIPREKIKSMQFNEDTNAVDEIQAEPVVTAAGLSFTGLPAGSLATVCLPDGKQIASYTVEGEWTLSFSELPKGICIVSVNGMSYKINVK